MKIGIIGAGQIGATIAEKLAANSHSVKLANSKGPDSIRELAEEIGATAVTKEQAIENVDVIIISIPSVNYPQIAQLFNNVPSNTLVVDTCNYYPFRDGAIEELVSGTPESIWVSNLIGRPVIKAWNAALAFTLAGKGRPEGSAGRIALPVAGDSAKAKATVMELVNATGFDTVDAGPLEESWRQQPGTPAYCTELSHDELKAALASAKKDKAPENRETLINEFMKNYENLTHEDTVLRNRAVTAEA